MFGKDLNSNEVKKGSVTTFQKQIPCVPIYIQIRNHSQILYCEFFFHTKTKMNHHTIVVVGYLYGHVQVRQLKDNKNYINHLSRVCVRLE